jgi:hypothetical protein
MTGRVVPNEDGIGFSTVAAVVVVDKVTGQSVSAFTDAQLRASPVPTTGRTTVADSTGAAFDPDACAHTYAYTNGLLTTDTATDGAASWVKTYTYTSGVLSAESKWVKQ